MSGGEVEIVHITCQSHRPAVNAAAEARLLAEGRRPVCFTVAVLLVVAHLQTFLLYITRCIDSFSPFLQHETERKGICILTS